MAKKRGRKIFEDASNQEGSVVNSATDLENETVMNVENDDNYEEYNKLLLQFMIYNCELITNLTTRLEYLRNQYRMLSIFDDNNPLQSYFSSNTDDELSNTHDDDSKLSELIIQRPNIYIFTKLLKSVQISYEVISHLCKEINMLNSGIKKINNDFVNNLSFSMTNRLIHPSMSLEILGARGKLSIPSLLSGKNSKTSRRVTPIGSPDVVEYHNYSNLSSPGLLSLNGSRRVTPIGSPVVVGYHNYSNLSSPGSLSLNGSRQVTPIGSPSARSATNYNSLSSHGLLGHAAQGINQIESPSKKSYASLDLPTSFRTKPMTTAFSRALNFSNQVSNDFLEQNMNGATVDRAAKEFVVENQNNHRKINTKLSFT